MKPRSLRTGLLALAFLIATPALAKPAFAGKGGTDILHLSIRTHWHELADPESCGELKLKLRKQGHADVQKADIEVEQLAGQTTYFLYVFLRDVVDPIEVLGFDTDEDGDATLKLMHLGHPNASGKVFPPGLDPLSDVVRMEIRNDADDVVLALDLADADRLGYLVKRRLDNEGPDSDAAGRLLMKQRNDSASFRLDAWNLDTAGPYELVIDGTSFGDFPADANGRLRIDALPAGAPLPFAMRSVELLDAADAVVLDTELP